MRLPSNEPVVLVPPTAGRFRRWLKSDMRVLRWVFLALYVLLVFAVLLMGLAGGDAESLLAAVIAIAVSLGGQALLVFGSGTVSLCRPIRRRRLVLPLVVAMLMLGVLLLGLMVAAWELLELDGSPHEATVATVVLTVVGASWLWWGVVMLGRLRNEPRYTVLRRLNTWIFAGSLAELLATVPSHVIVSRRPGCLVGIGTGIGIIAGVYVMLFSFGPAIAILFLRPRWRAELADGIPYCPACGYDLRASRQRCPECGLPVAANEWRRTSVT